MGSGAALRGRFHTGRVKIKTVSSNASVPNRVSQGWEAMPRQNAFGSSSFGNATLRNCTFRNRSWRSVAGGRTCHNITMRSNAANIPNLRNETIAPRRYGFDVARAVLTVLQCFAQYRDVLGKIRLFDEGVRPDLSQQFIFLEQMSSILNEDDQGIERLRRQTYLNLMAKQEALGGIQAKRAELKNHFCLRGHMTFTKALEKLYAGLKTHYLFCG
jgi:hypothetical protein